jgi:hypothetical protein
MLNNVKTLKLKILLDKLNVLKAGNVSKQIFFNCKLHNCKLFGHLIVKLHSNFIENTFKQVKFKNEFKVRDIVYLLQY